MLKSTLLLLSMACTPALATTDMITHPDAKIFNDTLQKELTNRATARYAISAITDQDLRPEALLFWQSYAKLESLNQARYTPVANELQLEPGVLPAWVKGCAAALYYRIAPNSMVGTMAKATNSYYEELSAIRVKVSTTYSEFYEYVLAQERAQADAFAFAAEGNYLQASKHLDDFVLAQQSPQ